MPSPTHMLKGSLSRAIIYIDRLPLFTRLAAVIMVTAELVSVMPWWDVKAWGRLEPDLFGLSTMYRTNTYPFLHTGVYHLVLNLIGVLPLLERFEAGHGTLTSLALFFGALSTIPALLYVAVEKFVLRSNTWVVGASVWGFLLIGSEAIRQNKTTPYLIIRGQPTIPTWTAPLALTFVAAVLMPGSSFLGHLCGLAVGYVYGLGHLNFLAPPDWALRWIEGTLKLRAWLPYYVSVDQKTYGRFGVLPMADLNAATVGAPGMPGLVGANQRLGASPE